MQGAGKGDVAIPWHMAAALAAPFSPLFGAATKYSWRYTLRLLAKDGAQDP